MASASHCRNVSPLQNIFSFLFVLQLNDSLIFFKIDIYLMIKILKIIWLILCPF